MKNKQETCHDCGVAPGELHKDGCDVERCPNCGAQRLSCDCKDDVMPRLRWTGVWPGVMECQEFGWYVPHGSMLFEDLNRLYVDAVWDRETGRFVLPEEKTK